MKFVNQIKLEKKILITSFLNLYISFNLSNFIINRIVLCISIQFCKYTKKLKVGM